MPRIRTVKPEFWQNEELAKASHHARLLAIALLNYADDKGCFLGTPALVRAACFPFEEDSKNILGSLQELSKIGYVELRECSGKTIGRVVKFLDHQRIDKAQKSKLIDAFLEGKPQKTNENAGGCGNSTTIPGTFQECSTNVPRLEGNGKEEECNSEDVSVATKKKRILKADLPSQEFLDWYLVYPRKEARNAALKAYKKAVSLIEAEKGISYEEAVAWLLERTRALKDKILEREAEYRPLPATWLNSGMYNDEPPEAQKVRRPKPVDFNDPDWAKGVQW